MQVSLNASINTAFSSATLAACPVKFNSGKARPGDVVFFNDPNELTTVQNTPEERRKLRKAIAAHLPRFTFWKVYIGDVNRHFGVNHYWEIPSARINEALSFIASMFPTVQKFPSYSQEPTAIQPPEIPENWENAKFELIAVLDQFTHYRDWFKQQSELMDYAITSINKTLKAIK